MRQVEQMCGRLKQKLVANRIGGEAQASTDPEKQQGGGKVCFQHEHVGRAAASGIKRSWSQRSTEFQRRRQDRLLSTAYCPSAKVHELGGKGPGLAYFSLSALWGEPRSLCSNEREAGGLQSRAGWRPPRQAGSPPPFPRRLSAVLRGVTHFA